MKNQASKNSLLRMEKFKDISVGQLSVSRIFRLHQIRQLTDSAYILRFDRNGMDFDAGQHITLGVGGDNQTREYSIYSTVHDPFLEVLVKEVDMGLVSKRLRKVKPGELLNVDGPFGFFTLDPEQMNQQKHLFIGTGTGIAPFHSLAGSYSALDYKILHGIRYKEEAYESNFYPADRYVLCTSKDERGDFQGRVTDYLKKNPVSFDTLVYLCGNCDMIYEVYDLLTSQGMPAENIKTEVYF
jgi:ferredoxin--NADP+ reductase/benzoate/toluate 1,2-dioxygenase reductase subunit